MTAYSGGSGGDLFGGGGDTKPVDREYAALWPAGTPGVGAAAGEHQEQTKRGLVYDAPKRDKKKRPAPKKQK